MDRRGQFTRGSICWQFHSMGWSGSNNTTPIKQLDGIIAHMMMLFAAANDDRLMRTSEKNKRANKNLHWTASLG